MRIGTNCFKEGQQTADPEKPSEMRKNQYELVRIALKKANRSQIQINPPKMHKNQYELVQIAGKLRFYQVLVDPEKAHKTTQNQCELV